MPKEKKVKKTETENAELDNADVSNEEADIEEKEDIGTPSYEELVAINEDLEKSVLRANADLDNALKRTINEVEKAQVWC